MNPTTHEVKLSAGSLRYRDFGGTGPPVVFVHGLLVDGRLWDGVAAELGGELRCIVPDLPLGSHTKAMDAGADLAPPAIADLLAELLDALDLPEATIVANDTGGAIAQMLADRHPRRVSRLVLTPCDTYDNFLPLVFRYLQVLARVPGAMWLLVQSMRVPATRRLPFAFGLLIKRRPFPQELVGSWVAPARSDAGVRRDAAKVLRGISARELVATAERLRGFDKPVLLAFAPEDRFFKLAHAERMAAELPNARVERIEDAYAFAPLDQPARVAALVRAFTGATA